jgi:hypothetical protein
MRSNTVIILHICRITITIIIIKTTRIISMIKVYTIKVYTIKEIK